ncbi:MAG: glycosyltransferase family 2 protein [Patescibacteria group bacterium]
MDLSVVTVTWNAEKNIAGQLRSVILACGKISFEQIVVDNASDDNTVAVAQSVIPTTKEESLAIGLSGGIKLLKNKTNLGFGAACNEGVAVSQGRFILFLNPDMELKEPGCLDKLVAYMDSRPEVGIVSCKLVDESGQLNKKDGPRRFPGFWNQLAIFLKIPHFFPSVLHRYQYFDLDLNKEQEVDSVRGSFMLARREFIEKLNRAFDERFFIWFEDVDLCREAKQLGYKVIYNPVISCVDLVGQSFKKRSVFWKQWQFFRSMFKYFVKWGL